MDYKKLGLRVGLEIHQQLNSGSKLFCRCPIMRSEEFPIEVRRKLRAVPGELGDTDPAALQEYLKNKTFIYKTNSESSCLVEIDDDPPKPVNENAVKTSIQMCKLLNCDIVNEIHFMRKTVVDGSAVSGFQRTALVGSSGCVEGDFGKVCIQTVMLEEDAATPISREHDVIEYRLDRLGIPLVEIATDSSINSPDMAKQVAEHIGLLLRSTDVVRGIGSIRQDINISIEQGERVEIKGFQELEKIPGVVINEVNRQIVLIEIKNELGKRGFKDIKIDAKNVTKIFNDTKSNFIRKIIDNKGFVYAVKLDKFSSLLKRPCGDRTFGRELSAYAEAYGLGIIHTDEDVAKYGLEFEFRKLREELSAGTEDLILITAGYSENQISNALSLIVKRANHCIIGVPKETRTADGEGSKYTRPLPGSGRLYPESDVPPVALEKKFISLIEVPKTLMERREEKIKEYIGQGMSRALAEAFASYKHLRGDEIPMIDSLSKLYPKIEFSVIARMIIEMPKELKTRFKLEQKVDRRVYVSILDALNKGEVPADSILYILVEHLTGKSIEESIEKYKIVTDTELKKIISDTIKNNKDKKESVLMGMIMQKVRGRIDGQKVAKMLREMM
ncbi:Glu-tRNA(Gln) amidotransferase subunit GatE [archaeon]|nr:Glu-tRNA(Gln) amidotransferase subunit GatE [archaeon]